MGPVSAEVEIDVPREVAFAAIADLARRPSFMDHFVDEFHLTRLDSSGVGAGARFRFDLPPRRLWADTAIAELEPPHRIVERGQGGRGNRIPVTTVWELVEGTGSLTRVRVSHWTEPASPLVRALDAAGGAAPRQERAWHKTLERLRELLESDGPVTTVRVAGGNRHATGVP
jgi:uncharacterized protein YndB with AHSA1/START domain